MNLIAFWDSESFGNAIRKAISLGGDSDFLTDIARGIAKQITCKFPISLWMRCMMGKIPPLRRTTTRFGNTPACLEFLNLHLPTCVLLRGKIRYQLAFDP